MAGARPSRPWYHPGGMNTGEGNQGPAALRSVPRTGVIYVMTEAAAAGYRPGDPAWSNLGQGMPETGPLPGAPPRVERIEIDPADQEYAPIAGIPELRAAIADLYNHLFRRGKRSQYTAENVCVSGGGRAALTRLAAALGPIHLGHFLPDYTAYEELLEVFRAFTPIPILLDWERGYSFSVEELRREILGRGLGALLFSNPTNPTGKVVAGESLGAWVATARRLDCALIIDEFYSHYIWTDDAAAGGDGARDAGEPPIVSAAEFVEDVDRDPVVIVDGLTKNWRYPGWRIAWTIGPRPVIEAVASAGSFLDGGGSRPLQRAAVPLLEPAHVRAETRAIAATFRRKRDRALARLTSMGFHVERPPEATFYVFGSARDLPAEISTGMKLFRAALERKTILVPGVFFDVNPGKRRAGYPSRFRHHVRVSFGPPEESVMAGLDRLEGLVKDARAGWKPAARSDAPAPA
jgi:aspartate/methionine/tyrosine aminotransferase